MKFKFILIQKVKVDHIDVDKWMFADADFTKFSSSEVFINNNYLKHLYS